MVVSTTLAFGEVRFQYRKRYGLHAMFGAPSGVPEAQFQYRKRYGLHAIKRKSSQSAEQCCFNTASGMDCMQ